MRKVSTAFSKSSATKSVINVWVEGGGADGGLVFLEGDVAHPV
jgi:L-rhamnose isomerase